MTPAIIAQLIALGLEVTPKLVDMITAWVAVKKEYPNLTPEMIAALLATVTSAGNDHVDSMQAQIDAYRKLHPSQPQP